MLLFTFNLSHTEKKDEVEEVQLYSASAQYMPGPQLLCTVRNCSVDSLAAAVRVKVGDILSSELVNINILTTGRG